MSSIASPPTTSPAAVSPELLAASRQFCRWVCRTRAKNFYYGIKLVPPPKRYGMEALYAWMREADDLADAEDTLDRKTRRLEEFLGQTDQALSENPAPVLGQHLLWPSVRDSFLTHRIAAQYLHDMIAGQLLDQRKTRYATFDELYDYCYKVASVVGLACIEIWGYEGGAQTRKLAEWRGIAFQLTNILRDVIEDARRDRVYLPADVFGVESLDPQRLLDSASTADEKIVAGLNVLADRAEDYFVKSQPLDSRVHPDGRPCLWAMTEIYHGILDKIRRNPAGVLQYRVRLSPLRKAVIALRAAWGM